MSNLIRLFPQSLQRDEFVIALIEAFEIQMRELYDEFYFITGKLSKNDFESLPETLIDYLAYERHVDFYENLTPEEKQNVVKNSFKVHRKKGTKQSLLTVFESLNMKAKIFEWFEYNGNPYHFKITLEDTSPDILKIPILYRMILSTKNMRSVLQGIFFKDSGGVSFSIEYDELNSRCKIIPHLSFQTGFAMPGTRNLATTSIAKNERLGEFKAQQIKIELNSSNGTRIQTNSALSIATKNGVYQPRVCGDFTL